MRGALGELDGVSDVAIAVGDPEFSVTYDPARVDVDAMLAALEAAGESAEPKR